MLWKRQKRPDGASKSNLQQQLRLAILLDRYRKVKIVPQDGRRLVVSAAAPKESSSAPYGRQSVELVQDGPTGPVVERHLPPHRVDVPPPRYRSFKGVDEKVRTGTTRRPRHVPLFHDGAETLVRRGG
jgi:hypothetical protein